MVDLMGALVTFLEGHAGVTAEVGAKVFGDELPPAEAANMPQKCVVLRWAPAWKKELGYAPLTYPSLDALCYGKTFAEADAVRRAVHDALKYIGSATPIITESAKATLDKSAGPVAFRDPEKQWPTLADSWNVTAIETAAA